MSLLEEKLMENANKANYELGRAEYLISLLFNAIYEDSILSDESYEDAKRITESMNRTFARIADGKNN